MIETEKIIDNNFIKLFKIDNKKIFYSLHIKKSINSDFIYSLNEYDIKDIEICCNIDKLNLSIFNNIEYITNHGNIKKLYLNSNNKNNIYISGIIPNKIIHTKY